MSHVIELNHLDQLNAFRDEWRELLSRTPGATFFQTLEWLEVYFKHFGEDQRLRVFVVRENQKVSGIVPLTVRPISTRVGKCRILTFPFDDWGSFYGPISANQKATLECVFNYIKSTPRDWDLIDFRCVDRADANDTKDALKKSGFPSVQFPWDQTFYVEFESTWEEYLKTRSSKGRRFLRAERKAQAEGTIEYIRYRPRGEAFGDTDPRWDLYDACVDIARKSWQGSSETGTTLSHESVSQYLRETHQAACHVGAVDINLLMLNGQAAAFAYNYSYRGWLYLLRLGFDPEISSQGLGRVLMGQLIRDSFQRGDRLFDMGVGSLDAKKYWLTSQKNSERFVHYAPKSPQATLLKLSHNVGSWFRDRFGTDTTDDVASDQPQKQCSSIDASSAESCQHTVQTEAVSNY